MSQIQNETATEAGDLWKIPGSKQDQTVLFSFSHSKQELTVLLPLSLPKKKSCVLYVTLGNKAAGIQLVYCIYA
jgi:hypothetical protein